MKRTDSLVESQSKGQLPEAQKDTGTDGSTQRQPTGELLGVIFSEIELLK